MNFDTIYLNKKPLGTTILTDGAVCNLGRHEVPGWQNELHFFTARSEIRTAPQRIAGSLEFKISCQNKTRMKSSART